MLRTSNEKFSHGMTINNNDIKAVYDQTPTSTNKSILSVKNPELQNKSQYLLK